MTTAGRATYESAKGGHNKNEGNLAVLSKQYSSKDMPGHLKLKYRQIGQGTVEELRNKDFKNELSYKEQKLSSNNDESLISPQISFKHPTINTEPSDLLVEKSTPTVLEINLPPSLINLDKDDDDDGDERSNQNSDFEDDSNSESDSEDETAELLAELQRIKKERAEEAERKEAERLQQEEKIRMENTKIGNPLMNFGGQPSSSYVVKRRWDDDVVFKNCNIDIETTKKKKFINDTIRSEFHRKFMDKYVQ